MAAAAGRRSVGSMAPHLVTLRSVLPQHFDSLANELRTRVLQRVRLPAAASRRPGTTHVPVGSHRSRRAGATTERPGGVKACRCHRATADASRLPLRPGQLTRGTRAEDGRRHAAQRAGCGLRGAHGCGTSRHTPHTASTCATVPQRCDACPCAVVAWDGRGAKHQAPVRVGAHGGAHRWIRLTTSH